MEEKFVDGTCLGDELRKAFQERLVEIIDDNSTEKQHGKYGPCKVKLAEQRGGEDNQLDKLKSKMGQYWNENEPAYWASEARNHSVRKRVRINNKPCRHRIDWKIDLQDVNASKYDKKAIDNVVKTWELMAEKAVKIDDLPLMPRRHQVWCQ